MAGVDACGVMVGAVTSIETGMESVMIDIPHQNGVVMDVASARHLVSLLLLTIDHAESTNKGRKPNVTQEKET